MTYYLYILECSDHSLYTGITTDLSRRLHEHNQTKEGAKYTRTRRPVVLLYSQKFDSRREASIAEANFKKLKRQDKLTLIGYNPENE